MSWYNRKGLIPKTTRIEGGIEDISKRMTESNNQLRLLKFSIFVALSWRVRSLLMQEDEMCSLIMFE